MFAHAGILLAAQAILDDLQVTCLAALERVCVQAFMCVSVYVCVCVCVCCTCTP